MDQPPAGETITILGFGSLLSERSSRLTFPDLTNFRLVRVPNHRRVFGHPASIFFQRKIADYSTLRMSSLSVEPCEGSSFIASAFEVPNNDMMSDGIPSQSFLEREEEFDIVSVPFLDGLGEKANLSSGIICRRSTDEEYVKRWGQDHFDKQFGQYDVKTIWNWSEDSGLLPCSVYLRHCYLAAQSMGKECFSSFLDETFLVDRQTKVRSYLDSNKEILETLPPPELGGRYSG